MTKEYKEGIYFKMPEEEYHNIPMASRSFLENILIDREDGWYYSAYNPNKPVHETTPAMQLGTAIHSMLLEPDIFKKIYVQQPSWADYKGVEILKDNKDLKAFLKKHGEIKLSTLVKAELVTMAETYLHPDTQIIWDNVIRDFKVNVEKYDKKILKQHDIEILDGIKESLELRPKIKKLLQGGYPEVVIIWEDEYTGITCKARLDYINIDSIIDLKSFSLKNKKPLGEFLDKEILYQNYNLQSSIYFDGLRSVIKKIRNKEAEVFGKIDQEWLSKFLENENKNYSIVFLRTQAPYQILEKSLITAKQDLSKSLCFTQGIELFRRAVQDFILCQEEFKEKRWLNTETKSPNDDIFMYQVQV